MRPQETQVGTSTPPDPSISDISARLDRLPVMWRHWQLVLLGQFMWGSVLLLDNLVARVYPVYWGPNHVVTQVQYAVLAGAATGFGPLVGGVLFGFLADRYGRKRIMIVSCLIAGLCVWPVGLSSSWPVILACVTVSALGIGGALAIVPSYNSEWCPPASRNRLMLGAQVLSQAMTQFLGTLVALLLLPDHVLAFVIVFAAVPIATVPLIMATMPESARWLEGKGRWAAADRIVSRLEEQARARHGDLPAPDWAAHGVVDDEKPRVLDVFRGVYRKRTLVLLTVWVFFYFGPGGGFTPFQSVYIVSKGYTPAQLFTILTIAGIGGVGGVFVASVLNERFERRQFVLIGALIFTVGTVLYFVAASSFAVLAVASIICSCGFGIMLNNLYNYSSATFPTRLRAVGTGWADGVGHVSAVFGPLIAGAWFTATAGVNHVGWFAWFLVVGSITPALILFRFGRNQRSVALEVASR